MNIFENWKNLLESMKKMSDKDINAWRTILIIMVVADLFGIYWYLNLKTLGTALLIVLIMGFAFLLIMTKDKKIELEKEIKKPKEKKVKKKVEEVEEEEKEESNDFGIDMETEGLPDAEDYRKNIDNALGKPLF
jgi:hypothetical protein